jgi:aminoglycoside phosphotransferase (APT) family kinase protein
MIPQIHSYLVEHWADLPTGAARPRDLAFLVQATGISKLCCFIFADDASAPQWVARLPRTPRDNPILAHEYAVIAHLRRQGGAAARAALPTPLHVTAIDGHLVGFEHFLRGQAMDGLMMQTARGPIETQARPYLDMAIGWLLDCQAASAAQRGRLSERQAEAHLLAPIARLRDTARLHDHERAYLGRLERRIRELARLPLPLVFRHGDFQPGNLLVDGGAVRVIDWEFGAIAAAPLLDVFGFLARTYARWHGREEMDGDLEDYLDDFAAVFFHGGRFAPLTGEYLGRACDALGLDPAWLPALFGLFVVAEANKYHLLLSQRAERGYVYLLNSRAGLARGSYREQLARQKHVWLLGYLAEHEQRAIAGGLGGAAGEMLHLGGRQAIEMAAQPAALHMEA